MTITIRHPQPADEARWRVLWQGYLTFYEQDLTEDVTQAAWDNLLDDGNALRGWIAVDDKDYVIGFVHYFWHPTTWATSGTVYLEDLFVDSTIRNSGAGRALIDAVGQDAKSMGCSSIYWKTNSHNETARKLYDKIATLSDFVSYDMDLK